MDRVCIYPKDIQIITGKSERYARQLVKKIKEALCKEEHQFITIEDFCLYTGICSQIVEDKLRA